MIDLDYLEKLLAESEAYSPGPWTVDQDAAFSVRDATNSGTADCATDEDERLIAAARNALPELIENSRALEQLVKAHEMLMKDLEAASEEVRRLRESRTRHRIAHSLAQARIDKALECAREFRKLTQDGYTRELMPFLDRVIAALTGEDE